MALPSSVLEHDVAAYRSSRGHHGDFGLRVPDNRARGFNRRRHRQIQLQKTLEDEDGGLLSALSQEPYARRYLGLVGQRGPPSSGGK